jgi:hypothetical protein
LRIDVAVVSTMVAAPLRHRAARHVQHLRRLPGALLHQLLA